MTTVMLSSLGLNIIAKSTFGLCNEDSVGSYFTLYLFFYFKTIYCLIIVRTTLFGGYVHLFVKISSAVVGSLTVSLSYAMI